jgi:hypothetical protein
VCNPHFDSADRAKLAGDGEAASELQRALPGICSSYGNEPTGLIVASSKLPSGRKAPRGRRVEGACPNRVLAEWQEDVDQMVQMINAMKLFLKKKEAAN